MKLNKFTSLLMIGLAVTVAASGCKKKPTYMTPLPMGAKTGTIPDGDKSGQIPGPDGNLTPDGTGGMGATPQANPGDWVTATRDEKIFENDTVHFAYDSHVVKASEKPKVEAVAAHLKANPNCGVEIQGHCDERGTDQYNYSLGERRATALREELIAMGVEGSRVLTVSFGRSRPVDTGHSDASHAKNRRGMFVLLTK